MLKKSLLVISGFLAISNSKAQTLTCANTCPQEEKIVGIKTASPVIGANGQNKLWNFSTVAAVSSIQDTYAYITPTAIAQSTLYPQTSVVLQKNGTNNYYLILANDGIKTAFPSTVTTNAQEVVLPLPFSYGNTFTQTIVTTAVENGDTYVTTKNSTISCLGTGTVVLPWSTYNNVVKVETVSNWTMTKNGGPFGYKQYLTEHTYYSTDIKHRVIYYSQRSEDGPTDYGPYTELLSSAAVGLAETTASSALFSFGPNPATTQLSIKKATGNLTTFTLYNALGEMVLSSSSNAEQTKLDVAALPRGMYLLVAESEGISTSKKLLLQ